MDNNHEMNNSEYRRSEINLIELFHVIWRGKWVILSVTSLFSLLSIIYSLSLPNIYQSKALLNPAGQQSQLNQPLRSFGGLASLAGFDLPSNSNNAIKAQEKLTTLSFFKDNILPNIFLADLMAIESWDVETNTISYNKDIFNKETQNWVRDFQYPKTQVPSPQESFRVFMDKLQVSEDQVTGFVTISIKHQSPFIAKAWTELIVDQLNYFFRVKDKAEAQAAMDYLNTQIELTSFSEIKQVIAELLKQKMQQLTLIEVTDFYVFEYIDLPVVMEDKTEPSRAFICILGTILGGIFGTLIILIRFYFKGQKSK